MDAKAIGQRIAELRKSKRIGQDVLAHALGVSRSTISLYESGKVAISSPGLHTVARALDVPIAYLLGDISLDELLRREERRNNFVTGAASPAQGFPQLSRERFTAEVNEVCDRLPVRMWPLALQILRDIEFHAFHQATRSLLTDDEMLERVMNSGELESTE